LEHITTPHFLTKYDQYVNMFVYLCWICGAVIIQQRSVNTVNIALYNKQWIYRNLLISYTCTK
jgi:hypothetical protein